MQQQQQQQGRRQEPVTGVSPGGDGEDEVPNYMTSLLVSPALETEQRHHRRQHSGGAAGGPILDHRSDDSFPPPSPASHKELPWSDVAGGGMGDGGGSIDDRGDGSQQERQAGSAYYQHHHRGHHPGSGGNLTTPFADRSGAMQHPVPHMQPPPSPHLQQLGVSHVGMGSEDSGGGAISLPRIPGLESDNRRQHQQQHTSQAQAAAHSMMMRHSGPSLFPLPDAPPVRAGTNLSDELMLHDFGGDGSPSFSSENTGTVTGGEEGMGRSRNEGRGQGRRIAGTVSPAFSKPSPSPLAAAAGGGLEDSVGHIERQSQQPKQQQSHDLRGVMMQRQLDVGGGGAAGVEAVGIQLPHHLFPRTTVGGSSLVGGLAAPSAVGMADCDGEAQQQQASPLALPHPPPPTQQEPLRQEGGAGAADCDSRGVGFGGEEFLG